MQLKLLVINASLTVSDAYQSCHYLTAINNSAIVDMSAIKTDVRSMKIVGIRRRYILICTNQLARQTVGRKNVGVGKTIGRNRSFVYV
jgi:hypothetical protein